MALEQSDLIEAQKALRNLTVLGQLQAQAATRGKNDGTHNDLVK
jgi:hypothetical protein